MNKGRRIAGFALLAGVAIGLTFYVTRPREPVYQGRALSERLADFNGIHDGEAWDKACEAVRQIGTNALLQICEMLRTEDSTARRRAIDWLNTQYHRSRFKTAEDAHEVAISACGILGPAANAALPDLRHHLLDVRNSGNCGDALGHIGPQSIPLLLEALTNNNASFHEAGALGLYMMGTNAQTAVPQLLAALKDPDMYTRRSAALALANVGQDVQTWMPVLLELLRHEYSIKRRSTISYLGEIGDKAKGFIPTLLIALEDEDSEIRRRAAEALKKIDPEAAAKAGVK